MSISKTPFMVVDLKPGEFHVARVPTIIKTLVGSCVSVCLHSRRDMVGAMSHCTQAVHKGGPHEYRPGHTEDLISLMLDEMLSSGVRISDITARLSGGANIFPGTGESHWMAGLVGRSNITAARMLLDSKGIPVVSERVGGSHGMKVLFNTATGELLTRTLPTRPPVHTGTMILELAV